MENHQKMTTLFSRVLSSGLLAIALTACLSPQTDQSVSAGSQTPPQLGQSPGDLTSDFAASETLYPRSGHTAVKMADGQVLVFGGLNEPMINPAKTEIYDPASNVWAAGPDLIAGDRTNGKGLLLADGRVLILGGSRLEIEVYDPADSLFHVIGSFAHSRNGASFTLLQNGEVLILGGVSSGMTFYRDGEIFDPDTNSLRPIFNLMATPRATHTATLMPSGDVLVTGGVFNSQVLRTTEVFNHNSEGMVTTNALAEGRFDHYAFLLPNGNVLAVGGSKLVSGVVQALDSVESYMSYGAFETLPALPQKIYEAAVAQLSNGAPVLTGGDEVTNGNGADSIYTYDLSSRSFILSGHLAATRKNHTLTVLDDDSILVVGGWVGGASSKSAERLNLE
jgi:hypothetical protein